MAVNGYVKTWENNCSDAYAYNETQTTKAQTRDTAIATAGEAWGVADAASEETLANAQAADAGALESFLQGSMADAVTYVTAVANAGNTLAKAMAEAGMKAVKDWAGNANAYDLNVIGANLSLENALSTAAEVEDKADIDAAFTEAQTEWPQWPPFLMEKRHVNPPAGVVRSRWRRTPVLEAPASELLPLIADQVLGSGLGLVHGTSQEGTTS